ncbi:MAG TPA: hypothetical protein VNJ08_03935 [Bacteriovoracaceae bacterium]|nr:hypothetical protein [Bacteriovoracaceae bacterium]
MKKFLAIYRGEPKGNDEWNNLPVDEKQKRVQLGMEAWGKWVEENSSIIVYPGGPLGKTLQVNKKGVSSIVNNDCAFVIIEATTLEEGASKFLNHPHFSIFPGENVEIMECLPVPGQSCS